MEKTRGAPLKYPWPKLKLKGKAIVLKGESHQSVSPSGHAWAKRHGRKFKFAIVPGGISVRRVA